MSNQGGKMKALVSLFLCCVTLLSTHVQSCPICVGRVSRQSAPFFSDACYCNKPKTKSNSTRQPVKISTKPTALNKKQGD